MTRLSICLGLALLAASAGAQAHSHLQSATPADGSVITAAPSTVRLKFSEATRLTAAWIQKGSEAKQKLAALPTQAATDVSVTLPALTPGRYALTWRAVSDDGHVVPGQIHFVLAAASDHATR
jgi:methionine-rich copper-binding protein CopC